MPYLEDGALDRGFLDFPSKIQIQTINRCNYECPMCPYPEVTAVESKSQLNDSLFRRLVDEVEAAQRRIKLCLMLQNEPFLDRRFTDMLAYAHDRPEVVASVSTVSNGSVLTEDLMDRLMEFDRFYLTISVNATDRQRYHAVHGKDLWPRIHRLLSSWRGRRDRVRLSFVLDSESLDQGREFRRFWGELGYTTRFVPIFARIDTMEVNAPVHSVDADYGHCHYPLDTLNVLADGSVILCCNDWMHDSPFGNLYVSSIAEVWNGPKLSRLRQMALEGSLRQEEMCKSCDYPIRSSQRLALEGLLDGADDSPGAAGSLPFATHRTLVRPVGHGPEASVMVWHLDEERGRIEAFVHGDDELPERVLFRLSIGQNGAFNFGSLEPVWCPSTLHTSDEDLGVEGARSVRIELDREAEEFRFFRWYCADWRLDFSGGGERAGEPAVMLAE